MGIRFNVTGAERKALVAVVSEITGWAAIYQKAPSFAYVVQNYTVDKAGTLLWDERTDVWDARRLLEELAERGFVSEDSLEEEATLEVPEVDALCDESAYDRLSIEVPLEGFTETVLVNLEKLVASKAALIRKVAGADALPIRRESDRLCFSWFSPDASQEEIHAYTQLVAALCEMAKNQKRVTATEKPADSEKYAFRGFLLRLGFIGPEYASARKILLQGLPGDSSFKNGKHKERDDAATEAPQAADSEALEGGSAVPPDGADTSQNAITGDDVAVDAG